MAHQPERLHKRHFYHVYSGYLVPDESALHGETSQPKLSEKEHILVWYVDDTTERDNVQSGVQSQPVKHKSHSFDKTNVPSALSHWLKLWVQLGHQ